MGGTIQNLAIDQNYILDYISSVPKNIPGIERLFQFINDKNNKKKEVEGILRDFVEIESKTEDVSKSILFRLTHRIIDYILKEYNQNKLNIIKECLKNIFKFMPHEKQSHYLELKEFYLDTLIKLDLVDLQILKFVIEESMETPGKTVKTRKSISMCPNEINIEGILPFYKISSLRRLENFGLIHIDKRGPKENPERGEQTNTENDWYVFHSEYTYEFYKFIKDYQ